MTEPPPLPEGMRSWVVQDATGAERLVVTVEDAMLLMRVVRDRIVSWTRIGQLEMIPPTGRDRKVAVDSLWAMVPEEFRRG